MVVAPSLTPEGYNPLLDCIREAVCCSSLSHPGRLQSGYSLGISSGLL